MPVMMCYVINQEWSGLYIAWEKQGEYIYKPSHEKTNIVVSAKSINWDQPKHAAQANLDRQFLPPVDFLFQESLLVTSIPLSWNVSAWISLHKLIWVYTLRQVNNVGFRRLIWVYTLRRVNKVGFLVIFKTFISVLFTTTMYYNF